ncbi:serine hydrolase [Sporosarcina sp. 179-K 8C2 HS]|uniref:serine hydrolase domain-containing protein n=1 Tax=Sporosarcina sp. 179-K 8C2 HS TaxID=3142387 RepID=UPI0039A28543
MQRKIGILIVVLVLVFFSYMLIMPDYKSFTYVGRAAFWGESDFYDHQKFAFRQIEKANDSHTFEYDLKESNIDELLMDINYDYKQKRYSIGDAKQFFTETDTTSFIIIKNDKIIYEKYFNDSCRECINTSFSVAKSFVSFLIGKAIEDGYIESIEEPITNYIPELINKGFEEISIEHLLEMSSGISYIEGRLLFGDDAKTYYSPNLRRLALEETKLVDRPGEKFLYNNYHPLLLGIILESSTQKTISEYLQETLWIPVGMGYSASWSIDSRKHGFEKMESGINARAIDFARFGKLYLNKGNWNGEQIISSQWVIDSTKKKGNINDSYYSYTDWDFFNRDQGYYKYMWLGYEREDGDYDFFAHGKYGQVIYVSPKNNVVIVRTGKTTGKVDFWPEILLELSSKLE